MSFYNHGKEIILNPNAVLAEAPMLLLSDIIRVALMKTTYTFDRAAHDTFDDISASEIVATGYTAAGDGIELASKTVTQNNTDDTAEFDAADLTYTSIGNGANDTFNQIVIFREPDTGAVNTNRELIAHTTVSSTTTNGGNITLVWSTAPSAILRLTHI